jgi:hypothetical protein
MVTRTTKGYKGGGIVMADEKTLREFLAQQFELTNTSDDIEGHVYYTLEFNTTVNVAGDGDFRVTLCDSDGKDLRIVDFEAGQLA